MDERNKPLSTGISICLTIPALESNDMPIEEKQIQIRSRNALLRRAALVSLCLNVVLYYFVMVRQQNTDQPQQYSQEAIVTNRTSTVLYSTSKSASAVLVSRISLKLPQWSSVQSEDLHAYVQNLRALGFPEPIIQHVIVAELDQVFSRKWAVRPRSTNFWQTGPQRNAQRIEENLAKREMESQRRRMIKDVLGVEWYETSAETWDGEKWYFSSIFGGSLTPEKVGRLTGLWIKFEDLAQTLNDSGQLLTPELINQRKQAEREMMSDLRQTLTAEELEEFELKAMSFDVGDVWGAESLFGSVLTGNELRELLRIRKGETSPLTKLLLHIHEEPKPSLQVIEEQDKQIRTLLGEERFRGYQLAKDFNFRGIHRSVRDLKMPIETSWTVYEAYRNARDQVMRLAEDATLAEEQRRIQFQNLRSETERALEKALGPEKYQTYMKDHRGWLEHVGNGKEPNGH